MKYPQKYGRQKTLMIYSFDLATLCTKNNGKMDKTCLLIFAKKSDFGITKNYRGTTFIAVTAKIYITLLLNRIRPAVEKILRKHQNNFRRNQSTIF